MSLPATTEPEQVLGRYVLGTRVGAGASGSVYSATDSRTGQTVVIKFFDGQEDGIGSWTNEMRLVLRFRHEHIVPCLDIGFDQVHGLWALVFAKAEGGSLRRVLASRRRFTPRQIAELLSDIASALAYAHAEGVIHRDVKPENILCQHAGEDTHWLLTDFGAGRFLASGESARSPAGSIEYMAPEAFNGQAGAVSDQYSLGVLGCELWQGRLPRRDELPAVQAALRGQGALAEVLARLCDPDPVARFASMDDVVRSLQQVLTDMKDRSDILVHVRSYLRTARGLSESSVENIFQEWAERGSLLDFLVEKKLLTRSMARTADAITKGYLDAPLESVFGKLEIKEEAQPSPIPVRVEPAKSEVEPETKESAPAPPPASKETAIPAVRVIEEASPPAPPAPPAPLAPPVREAAVSRRDSASQSEGSVRIDPPSRSGPPVRPAPGVRLGRYVLQEALGEGATATVFRSFHELLSMPVAIKVFEPLDASSDPEAATRFRREAQTLVRLQHPNIVRIVDIDVFDGRPFIVMEYVGETTLATQIQNLGRLPAPRIAQIGLAVVEALDAATRQGLTHRDVKPSNILERKDGHIKLVDFGIAARRTTSGVLSDPLAALGLVSGTPAYIAPEQALHPSQIDFRADMYSLGATLYHAATGRTLFQCNTAQELLTAHINQAPVHINDLDPGFDPHLAYVIHHMLAKQPEDRFASWNEVREALGYSLYRQDEPELQITQTSTGLDLPRPAEDGVGASASSLPGSGSAGAAAEKGVSAGAGPARASASSLRVVRPSSSSLESIRPVDRAVESPRSANSLIPVSSGGIDAGESSRPTPVSDAEPSSEPTPKPALAEIKRASSPRLLPLGRSTSTTVESKLQRVAAQLLESWKASPRSERGLAIAAVTLLLLTTLFLFAFSGRG